MKKIIFIIITAILSTVYFGSTFTDNAVSNNNVMFNFSERNILDIGVSADLFAEENLIDLLDLYSKRNETEYVIDLNEIYSGLNGSNGLIRLNAYAESFAKVNLFGIKLALKADINTENKIEIPNEILKFISEGNEIGENIQASGSVDMNTVLTSGIYAGINSGNFGIGISGDLFLPLIYSDPEAYYNTYFNTENGGVGSGAIGEIPVYSVFNSEEIKAVSEEMILEKLYGNSGIKFDIDFVGVKNDSPYFGISLGNIVLRPAVLDKKLVAKFDISAVATDLLGTGEYDTSSNFSFEDTEEVNMEYKMPLKASAFVKLPVLFFDVTPFADVYFDKEILFDWGTYAEGRLLGIIPYHLSFTNINSAWGLETGFGIDLHAVELYIAAGTKSSDINNLFNLKGISAKINISVGL